MAQVMSLESHFLEMGGLDWPGACKKKLVHLLLDFEVGGTSQQSISLPTKRMDLALMNL